MLKVQGWVCRGRLAEVRVSIPGAVVGADLQRMTDGRTGRLRLFFVTEF